LSTEIAAGKAKAVALVEADPVLTTEVKTVLEDRLRHAEVSRTSHPPGQQEVIARLGQAEQQALTQAPAPLQDKVKQTFAREKAEISVLWPKIQDTFTRSVARAFQNTFHLSSWLMMIGILFAVFSDGRRYLKAKK
jgi:hypothetical protein